MIIEINYVAEFYNVIVGLEMLQCCQIIPRESILINEGNSNGDVICNYSMQICWFILNILVGKERTRGCMIISTEIIIISYINNNFEELCSILKYSIVNRKDNMLHDYYNRNDNYCKQ